jgi:hypothetical protein
MCWYLLGRRLSEIPGPEEVVITNMIDEIAAESEYKYERPVHRELLPVMIYRDMIRERWVWPGTCSEWYITSLSHRSIYLISRAY